jgi:light-harvesting complex I chlorophyll a/b binding protein 4
MASITARAPVVALRPSTSFGHSGRVGQASPSSSTKRSLRVEAKGEWLPGLTSPAYLDGK